MNVLMFQQRNWAKRVGIPLAKHLKHKINGVRLAAWVYKVETWEYFERNSELDDLFDYRWLGYKSDDLVRDPKAYDQFRDLSIDTIERELGIQSVWKELIFVDRNLVYNPGKKWRYEFSKQLGDDTLKDLVRLNYWFVDQVLFKEFPPDVVILPGFGSLFHNVLYHYCAARGIKCLMVNTVKLSDRYILTSSKFYDLPEIWEPDVSVDEQARSWAERYIKTFREQTNPPEHFRNRQFAHQRSVRSFFSNMIKALPKGVRQAIRNRNPNHPNLYKTLDNISGWRTFKGIMAENLRLLRLRLLFQFDNLPNERFLFFPLHVTPEISTNLWAPDHTNQLEVIRKTAISLPGDVVLVVKEHPMALGQREIAFYEQIQGLLNVRLISHKRRAVDIINNPNCLGSIVISGTTGFESALLGKLSIVLSTCFYQDLPNCFRLRPEEVNKELLNKFSEVQTEQIDRELVELVARLYVASFQDNYASVWGRGHQASDSSLFENITSAVRQVQEQKSAVQTT